MNWKEFNKKIEERNNLLKNFHPIIREIYNDTSLIHYIVMNMIEDGCNSTGVDEQINYIKKNFKALDKKFLTNCKISFEESLDESFRKLYDYERIAYTKKLEMVNKVLEEL